MYAYIVMAYSIIIYIETVYLVRGLCFGLYEYGVYSYSVYCYGWLVGTAHEQCSCAAPQREDRLLFFLRPWKCVWVFEPLFPFVYPSCL